MENQEKTNIELPENAFRELKDGEEYEPIMKKDRVYPEVSLWSVTWGYPYGSTLFGSSSLPRLKSRASL